MKKFIIIKLCAGIILLFTVAVGQAFGQQRGVSDSTLNQRFKKFESLESLEAREDFYRETREAFPPDTADFTSRFTHDLFLAQLAKESLLTDNLKKYRKYQEGMNDPKLLSIIMGKLLVDWAEDDRNAEKIRDTGERYLSELEDGKQVRERTVRTIFLEKFGSALLKIGEDEKALEYFEQALEGPEPKKSTFLADYAIALAKSGDYTKAKNILSTGLQSEEKKREPLLIALKEVFVLEGGDLERYDAFIGALDRTVYEQVYEEALVKREEHPGIAPDFKLRNLDGQSVSLADLKGKVIVLDFWATWCMPCKASFPGMQMAVEAYEDDPDVQFLFVNAFERTDAKQRVESYMDKQGYPFEVLLDSDNVVSDSYGVKVLPTKVVIGPEGTIQFRSTGLEGNDMAVFNHVKAMIEIAGSQNN